MVRPVQAAPEHRVRAEADALRAAGVSFNVIAATLNRRGIPGQQGGRWYAASVRRMLARPEQPLSI